MFPLVQDFADARQQIYGLWLSVTLCMSDDLSKAFKIRLKANGSCMYKLHDWPIHESLRVLYMAPLIIARQDLGSVDGL